MKTFSFLCQGKDIGDEDKFVYNKSFTHRLIKVKINQVQLRETVIL